MNKQNDSFLKIAATLSSAQTIAISGHVTPDGDCLGSTLALGHALNKMGKKVMLLSPDPVPQRYLFLPGSDQIKLHLESNTKIDLFVVLDTSVPDRLGGIEHLLDEAQRVIVIDHHAGATQFGHIYFNDPGAAAVGEIIFDLLSSMDITLDLDMAICLYVAIVTDTGFFRYDNTTDGTLLRAAKLIQTGVKTAQVNQHLNEQKPLVSIQLLQKVLPTFQVSDCGKIAWMSVTKDMLTSLGATDEHVEGMIDYPRTIKGVELALFYREIEPNRYKVSFRSKNYFDVNQLAARFNGGGHVRAAGCVMTGTLEEIQKQVHQAAKAGLRND